MLLLKESSNFLIKRSLISIFFILAFLISQFAIAADVTFNVPASTTDSVTLNDQTINSLLINPILGNTGTLQVTSFDNSTITKEIDVFRGSLQAVSAAVSAMTQVSPQTIIFSAGTLDLNNNNVTVKKIVGEGSIKLGSDLNTLLTLQGSDPNFSGSISGSGQVVVDSSAVVSFHGASSYVGGTTIKSLGSLLIYNDNALGDTSFVDVNKNGNLNLNDTTITIKDLLGSGNIHLGSLDTTILKLESGSFEGKISGAGQLSISAGSNTVELMNANLYTGGTSVVSGTLQIDNGDAIGPGTLTLRGGTFLGNVNADLDNNIQVINTGGSKTIAATTGSTLELKGDFILDPTSDTLSFGDSLGHNGTITLNNASSNIGTLSSLIIESGVLKGGTSNPTLNRLISNTSTMQLNNIATLELNNNSVTVNNLTANGQIKTGDSEDTLLTIKQGTINGKISGAGGIDVDTSGFVALGGANTYSGGTTISNGSLMINNSQALGTGFVDIRAGMNSTLELNGNSITISDLLGNGGLIKVSFVGTVLTLENGNYSGVIVNAGMVEVNGGLVILSGSNTYTGGTLLTKGVLEFTNTKALSTGAINFNGGELLSNVTGSAVVSNGLSFNGSGGIGVVTGDILTLMGALNIANNAGDIQFGDDNNHNGTIILQNSAISVGTGFDMTVESGTLKAPAANTNLGTLTAAADSVTVENDASLDMNDNNITINNLLGDGNIKTGTALTTLLTLNNANFGGVISGTGQVHVTNGLVKLAGKNTYAGGTTLISGILELENTEALSTNVLNFNAGELLWNVEGTHALSNEIHLNSPASTKIIAAATGDTLDLTGNLTIFSGSGLLQFGDSDGHNGKIVLENSSIVAPNLGFNLEVRSGELEAGNNTVLNALTSNATMTTIDGGASLSLNDNNVTIQSLLGDGNIKTGDSSSTIITLLGGNFSGVISGDGGVNINTIAGVLLGGANTYSGGTTITAGTLKIDDSHALGTGFVDVAGSGILSLNDFNATIANLLGSGSVVTGVSNNTVLTLKAADFAGVISGAGQINAAGGTVLLSGNNTYTGGTTISSGILQVNTLSSIGTGAITFQKGELLADAGGTLTNNLIFASTDSTKKIAVLTGDTLDLTGGLTVNADAGNIEFGDTDGHDGTIVLANSSNLVNSGFTLEVESGSLQADTANTTLNALTTAADSTTVKTGATLDMNDNSITIKNLLGSGDVVTGSLLATHLTLDSADFSGIISGAGQLDITGGLVKLSGVNTFTGGTILTTGILEIENTSAVGPGPITFNGGELLWRMMGSSILPNDIIINAPTIFAAGTGDTLTLTGDLTVNTIIGIGDGTLQFGDNKGNDGTVILDNANATVANNFGYLLVESGTLEAGDANSTLNALTLNAVNTTVNDDAELSMNDNSITIQDLLGSGHIATGTSSATTLTLENAVYNGVISGAGALIAAGGTLELGGDSTYTGGTNLQSGTVKLDDDGALGTGTITFNGAELIWNKTQKGTLTNDLVINVSTTIAAITDSTLELTGNLSLLSSVSTLTFNGGGDNGKIELKNSGHNVADFTDLVVQAGELEAGSDNSTLNSLTTHATNTTVDSGATLSLNDNSVTINNLLGSGQVKMGDSSDATLTLKAANFSGVISGDGRLDSVGGLVILAGDNTYSGGTDITSGTLQVGNPHALGTGDVNVHPAGTLDLFGFNLDIEDLLGSGTVTNSQLSLSVLTLHEANFSGLISGDLQLDASGGTVILSGSSNSYTGGTVLNSGVLQFNSTGALSTGPITFNGGELLSHVPGTTTLTNDLIFASTNASKKIGVLTGDTLNLTGVLTVDPNAGNLEFGDTHDHNGTIVLANSSSTVNPRFTLEIESGLLQAAVGNGTLDSLTATADKTTVEDPGTLAMNNNSIMIKNLLGTGHVNTGSSSATILSLQAADFSGIISGAGQLDVIGGLIKLSGHNTYAGGTTLTSGTLEIENPNALGTGDLNFENGELLWHVSGNHNLVNDININAPASTKTIAVTTGDTLTLTGGLNVNANSGTLQFGDDASHNGKIVLQNNNSSASSPFAIVVESGELEAASNNTTLNTLTSIATSTTVNNSAVLAMNDNSITINDLLGSGQVKTGDSSDATLTLKAANFSGVISGDGRLNSTGGLVILAGDNTYSGGTDITSGTLQVGNPHALGTGDVNVHPAGTLDLFGFNLDIEDLLGSGTVTNSQSSLSVLTLHEANFSGLISGDLQLDAAGGTVILSGASNTYTGGTLLKSGVLQFNNTGALSTGPITFNGGELLSHVSGTTTLTNDLIFASTSASKKIGVLTGDTLNLTGVLTVDPNAGNLEFGDTHDHNGTIVLANSSSTVNPRFTLEIESGLLQAAVGNGTLDSLTATADKTTVEDPGTLAMNNNSITIKNLLGTGHVNTGSSSATILSLQAADFAGIISGAGQLDAIGGLVKLSGMNTYTGGTTLTSGTVEIDNINALSTGPITFNGGELLWHRAGSNNNLPNDLIINAPTTFAAFNDETLTLSGHLTVNSLNSGTGTLQFGDSSGHDGTVVLDNKGSTIASDFGNLLVRSGTLKAGDHNPTLSDLTANAVTTTVDEGATLLMNDNHVSIKDLLGSGHIKTGDSDDTTLTLKNADFSGVISGNGKLDSAGGLVELSGDNTYSGGTIIRSGILQTGNKHALGTGKVDIHTGGTLDLNDISLSISNLVGHGSVVLGTLNSTVLTLHDADYAGVISGAGQLNAAGGTVNLLGDNTYAGGTTITSGILQFEHTHALSTGDITFHGGELLSRVSNKADLDNNIVLSSNDNTKKIGVASGDTLQLKGHLTILPDAGTFAFNDTHGHDGTIILDNSGHSISEKFKLEVEAGKLKAASDNSTLDALTDSATSTNIQDHAILDMNNNNITVQDLLGNGEVTMGNSSDTLLTLKNADFSGVISGEGALIAKGGLVKLAGHNTYKGGTTIETGTLEVGNEHALSNGIVDIKSEGTLDQADHNLTLGDLIGSGHIKTGSSTSTILTLKEADFSGSISGAGQMRAEGGEIILKGESTYSGGTTLKSGTLQIENVKALGLGPVTFDAGELLADVSGVFTNDLIFNSTANTKTFAVETDAALDLTGALNVNASAGTLRFGNNSHGGTVILDNSSTTIADTNFDLVIDPSILQGGSNNPTLNALTSNAHSTTIDEGSLILMNDNSIAIHDLLGSGTIATGNSSSTDLTLREADFTGDINGSGHLTVKGGEVKLFGTSSYTGGTTVSSGELKGTTKSIQGNITNNAKVIFDQNFDGTYASEMSGSGSLSKAGTSTLTLTGANRYTGGTTVDKGVLKGNTTSLQGNINNKAEVIFDQDTDGTYSGTLKGSGKLTKIGPAKLTLTSSSNQEEGGTTIKEGTLAIGDTRTIEAKLASNVTAEPKTTLSGTGTIDGNVVNFGKLLLGNAPTRMDPTQIVFPNIRNDVGSDVGAMHVTGNYTQKKDSIFIARLNDSGFNDELSIGKQALLEGGTLDISAGEGDFLLNHLYVLIFAQEGRKGKFTDVDIASTIIRPFLIHDLDYTKNGVTFLISFDENAFHQAAKTRNQKAVANYILTNGATVAIDSAIESLETDTEFRVLMDELSGATIANQTLALSEIARWFDNQLSLQIDEFGVDCVWCALQSRKNGVWAVAQADNMNIDATDVSGLNTTNAGLALGTQIYFHNNEILVGGAFGYTHFKEDAVVHESANAQGNLFQFGLYGQYQIQRWDIGASVAFGLTDNISERRKITSNDIVHETTGNYDADIISSQLRVGYDVIANKDYQVKPFVGILQQNLVRNGFAEGSGNGFELAIQKETFNSLRSQLGLGMTGCVSRSLQPFASIAWEHEFSDSQGQIEANFIDVPGHFTAVGTQIGTDAVSVDVGINLTARENLGFGLLYKGQFASGLSENAVQIGAVYNF